MTSLSDSALPWETRKRETLYCTADTVAIITFIDDKIKSRNEKIKPFSNAKNEKVTWSPKDLFLSFVAFVCRYDFTTLSPCQLAVFFQQVLENRDTARQCALKFYIFSCPCTANWRGCGITTATLACIEIRVFNSDHHARHLYLSTKFGHTYILSEPNQTNYLYENYTDNK